jgi:hypothetical protein
MLRFGGAGTAILLRPPRANIQRAACQITVAHLNGE